MNEELNGVENAAQSLADFPDADWNVLLNEQSLRDLELSILAPRSSSQAFCSQLKQRDEQVRTLGNLITKLVG